jgi:hypothetical protein
MLDNTGSLSSLVLSDLPGLHAALHVEVVAVPDCLCSLASLVFCSLSALKLSLNSNELLTHL